MVLPTMATGKEYNMDANKSKDERKLDKDIDVSSLICPLDIDPFRLCPSELPCETCRKNYWLKEVQNER